MFQEHVEKIEFSQAEGDSTYICDANVTFALKGSTGASKQHVVEKFY